MHSDLGAGREREREEKTAENMGPAAARGIMPNDAGRCERIPTRISFAFAFAS